MDSYLSGIEKLVQDYLQKYPTEVIRLNVLLDQLSRRDPTLNSRSNMIGHLTASALVLNDSGRCLLIAHKALKRWLQPGGHLEQGESPEQGALRELMEETGIRLAANGAPTIDIDSHQIPASEAKGEASHLHHDFQFVYHIGAEGAVVLEEKEAEGFKWVHLTELLSGDYGSRLARVAGKLLN